MNRFEDYEAQDYEPMMEFILRVESVQAWRFGAWLIDKLHPSSVIDIGCGPGIYLVPFALSGASVLGVDACAKGGECLYEIQGAFERFDLRFPYYAPQKFRLAICMEVAEHLHAEYADTLMDTICVASDMVLFTGAVPGQGGTNHYNEQPHSYWIQKFADRGYSIHPLQEEMRAFLQTLPANCSGWLKNNSFLFKRMQNADLST